jgi:hypothetical protein
VEARDKAKAAKEAATAEYKKNAVEARERLAQSRRESVEASEAQKKAYREGLKNQRTAARNAAVWDAPIRREAAEARTRLANADPKASTTIDDLVSVATEKFLPKQGKSVRGIGNILPTNFYSSLRTEFPNLVTRKNQYEIYKRSYARATDMAEASREVARLKSADKESRKLWDELGIDEEAHNGKGV